MNKDEIISMAREAGMITPEGHCETVSIDIAERFAALVAAHEREKRTQELMQLFLDPENQPTQFGTATLEYREQEVLAEREACAKLCEEYHVASEYPGYVDCAAAIRERDVDSLYTSHERVEKTEKFIHDCGVAQHHRYSGSFSD